MKKKLGHQIVFENEYMQKDSKNGEGFKDLLPQIEEIKSINISNSQHLESVSVSNQYNIKVDKYSSESSEESKSDVKDPMCLQASPELDKEDGRRLSGRGMNFFKTVFEQHHQRNKIQRLATVVKIAEKHQGKQAKKNNDFIKKLKEEIKNTRVAEKEMKEPSRGCSDSQKSFLFEEFSNNKISMIPRVNSMGLTNKITPQSLQMSRRASWNPGVRNDFNIRINTFNEATNKLPSRLDTFSSKIKEMEDSIISDDISSSDSNEGTETLNILTPTSDNQTEKITQKPGLHKSTEKTTKNKKGHEKSNIFDINMRKRKNDKLKDLCDSKPKYLPTMSNVKRVHKSHTSLKKKGISSKFKALITSSVRNNQKTAPIGSKRSHITLCKRMKPNPYTKSDKKKNGELSSRLGSPLRSPTEISSPIFTKQDLLLRKRKAMDYSKFQRRELQSPKRIIRSSRIFSSPSLLLRNRLQQNSFLNGEKYKTLSKGIHKAYK